MNIIRQKRTIPTANPSKVWHNLEKNLPIETKMKMKMEKKKTKKNSDKNFDYEEARKQKPFKALFIHKKLSIWRDIF